MKKYDEEYICRLIHFSLLDCLSDEEEQDLEDWKKISKENELFFQKVKKEFQANEIRGFVAINSKDAWKAVKQKTQWRSGVLKNRCKRYLKYAALIIPVLLSVWGVRMWKKGMLKDDEGKKDQYHLSIPILTLSNGEVFHLDLNKIAEIESNGDVKAYASGVEIVYDTLSQKLVEDKYNTLSVPKGSEYKIVLADGTKVWLNAASELRFPIAFQRRERRVYLKGEAYFEVTPNSDSPFYVETEELQVCVLGTSFNINTHYLQGIRTTLVEGEISLSFQDQEFMMRPGELAEWDRNTSQVSLKKVDVLPYISWKEGYFVFKDESLEEIMHALALWYDKEFCFLEQKHRKLHFSGHLKRYDDIETILSAIKEVTEVQFQINGQVILIY